MKQTDIVRFEWSYSSRGNVQNDFFGDYHSGTGALCHDDLHYSSAYEKKMVAKQNSLHRVAVKYVSPVIVIAPRSHSHQRRRSLPLHFHVFVFRTVTQVELQILDLETDWEKSVQFASFVVQPLVAIIRKLLTSFFSFFFRLNCVNRSLPRWAGMQITNAMPTLSRLLKMLQNSSIISDPDTLAAINMLIKIIMIDIVGSGALETGSCGKRTHNAVRQQRLTTQSDSLCNLENMPCGLAVITLARREARPLTIWRGEQPSLSAPCFISPSQIDSAPQRRHLRHNRRGEGEKNN